MIQRKVQLTFIFFLALTSYGQADQTKNDLMLIITSAHTKVFGKDNLIVSRLMPNDLAPWSEAFGAVKQFITKYNAGLTPDFETIKKANNILIQALKVSFDGFIAPALKDPKDQKEGLSRPDSARVDFSKIDVEGLKNIVANNSTLLNQIDVLQDLQQTLDKKLKSILASKFAKKEKGDACEVLIRLALTLETSIEKATKDARKLIASAQPRIVG